MVNHQRWRLAGVVLALTLAGCERNEPAVVKVGEPRASEADSKTVRVGTDDEATSTTPSSYPDSKEALIERAQRAIEARSPRDYATLTPPAAWVAERCGERFAAPKKRVRLERKFEAHQRKIREEIAACGDLIDFERAELLGMRGGRLRRERPALCGGTRTHHWVEASYDVDGEVFTVEVVKPSAIGEPPVWVMDNEPACRPAHPGARAAFVEALHEALVAEQVDELSALAAPRRLSEHCADGAREVAIRASHLTRKTPEARQAHEACRAMLAGQPAPEVPEALGPSTACAGEGPYPGREVGQLELAYANGARVEAQVVVMRGEPRESWRLLGAPRCVMPTKDDTDE